MVIVEREVERDGQRRRLENKRKGGISTSNMTTTQGAGLRVRGMGGGRETKEEERKGGRGELWLLCSFWSLPF